MKAERFVGKTKKHTGFKAEDVKEQIPKEIDNTPLQMMMVLRNENV